MIKTFEQYISERLGRPGRWMRSNNDVKMWIDVIDDIDPGQTITVYFPEDFELECREYNGKEDYRKFICTKLEAYYWDDDDHRTVDYYFYESEESYKSFRGGWYGHTCKIYDLTKESREKVEDYLENTPAPIEK